MGWENLTVGLLFFNTEACLKGCVVSGVRRWFMCTAIVYGNLIIMPVFEPCILKIGLTNQLRGTGRIMIK